MLGEQKKNPDHTPIATFSLSNNPTSNSVLATAGLATAGLANAGLANAGFSSTPALNRQSLNGHATLPDGAQLHASTTVGTGELNPTISSAPSVGTPSSATTPTATSGPARLVELVHRAETIVGHLENRLADERAAAERAARASADIDERLRLGVRMLQAFDVQVERGEGAATRANEALAHADESLRARNHESEAALNASIERLAQEKFQWLERELNWRFERVQEVEARIEQVANSKLAWLDNEIEQRLGRLSLAVSQAEAVATHTETVMSRVDAIASTVDRAERATAALAGLSSEGERHIETLAQRTSDAGALREALSTLVHELAASREVVQGEMRRMRDDLGWLVEKSERLTGELVERADHAVVTTATLCSASNVAAPLLAELSTWAPLLNGADRTRIRPLTDAISAGVRDELSADMRGFASALRQLAARADGAFANIRIDAPNLAADPRELARTFATEISRLDLSRHAHSTALDALHLPSIAVNRALELDITDHRVDITADINDDMSDDRINTPHHASGHAGNF